LVVHFTLKLILELESESESRKRKARKLLNAALSCENANKLYELITNDQVHLSALIENLIYIHGSK